MNNFKHLSQLYDKKAHIGKKSVTELVEFLNNKGIIEKTPVDKRYLTTINSLIYNIKNVEKERNTTTLDGLSKSNQYKFIAYKFPRCVENDKFYKKYKIQQEKYEKFIYVIIEVNRCVLYSNCSKLQLELFIYKGIDEGDVKNKTIDYYEHLFYLEAYEHGWY